MLVSIIFAYAAANTSIMYNHDQIHYSLPALQEVKSLTLY